MTDAVFRGLKVIDCGSYIAAPAAATVMSDFGADVIKIEPPSGDPYRTRNQPPKVQSSPVNPHWFVDARNKRSLAVDLTVREGLDILYRLVATADVFITNYPPNVRAKLGLTYQDVSRHNPRLIYASFTGFGEAGPEANKPGFDATAWWARTGMMDLVRAGDAPPVRLPQGMGDHCSAMGVYSAIVTALYRRERTGLGAYVGSSLLMNGVWANACSIQTTLCGEEVERPIEREKSAAPWRNIYKCLDGKWILLSVVHNERQWNVLRRALGTSKLDDPRFQTVEDRKANAFALTEVLDRIFSLKRAPAWRDLLDGHGVVFAEVASLSEVCADSQVALAGALVPTEAGPMTVSSPFWIHGEEKVAPRPAPRLGEHTDAVLTAAGLDHDAIDSMRLRGIVR
ncbi:CoA transferase [Bradyrhizobium sp. LHD-71]|uniref:CaiB/BaiF CoA transferase family protein n=1 Tax=Bradyrhizobium sp. LHD-71 TaxID=3072141 RepID=UPI00280DC65B|nr:CoA transferase [Bradyrhizobium sp. LHD-71]MDQ8728205.1 CoA transferase [Bradyrhizobium sp. LHD-71]